MAAGFWLSSLLLWVNYHVLEFPNSLLEIDVLQQLSSSKIHGAAS